MMVGRKATARDGEQQSLGRLHSICNADSNTFGATYYAEQLKGGGGGCVPIVYSEDYDSSVTEKKKEMGAMRAVQKDDILCTNWSISFINSQVLLKGIETRGHLIMSAAKAHVEHNLHKPVWINDSVFSKSSWVSLNRI